MGKKGSWFSKIKRVFTPHSKEKLSSEAERKCGNEKRKKGSGKLCGDTSSFLPIFREPSSIEKIFGEAERDHNLVFRPPTPSDRSNPSSPSPPHPLRLTSPRPTSPRAASPEPPPPPRADLSRLDSPRSLSSASASTVPPPPPPPPPLRPASTRVPSQRIVPPSFFPPKPVPQRVASPQAVSIKPPSSRGDSPQALPLNPPPREDPPRLNAPRPSTSSPSSPKAVSPKAEERQEIVSRPESSLSVQQAYATKIQAAFRGYKARRSYRALKSLARLQGFVKGYKVTRQTVNAMKYMQQLVRVQSQIQSRRIKTLENQAQVVKAEAKRSTSEAGNGNWDESVLTKEERNARSQRKIDAIINRERSMAYAFSHKLWKNSPKSAQDVQNSNGLSLWWNWGDRQLPLTSHVPSHRQPLRDYMQTPSRLSPSPMSQSSNQHHFRHDNNFDTSTPTSSRSTFLTPSRPFRTSRYSIGRLRGQDSPFKDDDSFASCPPYPRYMAPTVSAKAKVRPNSNPKERVMGTLSVSSETRRMSYPPTQQGLDMFRWNKGSLHMSNSGSHRGSGSPGGVVLEKHKTLKSVGNSSIGTTISMPATVGRKPFNIYV
ncbi:protein IQ-DOMAIN 14 isoform X2 [Raphanus sativus]|uniref:Protein IQ-DOMAIN 14 isoform X2 n=1 Tax=Raphanus sativus TaxID=3726 RepID=A0A6J0MK74_RAPSA|nr:protein IQ-DOMAIN 14 isoform X2 [Raphanus sativus]